MAYRAQLASRKIVPEVERKIPLCRLSPMQLGQTQEFLPLCKDQLCGGRNLQVEAGLCHRLQYDTCKHSCKVFDLSTLSV